MLPVAISEGNLSYTEEHHSPNFHKSDCICCSWHTCRMVRIRISVTSFSRRGNGNLEILTHPPKAVLVTSKVRMQTKLFGFFQLMVLGLLIWVQGLKKFVCLFAGTGSELLIEQKLPPFTSGWAQMRSNNRHVFCQVLQSDNPTRGPAAS